MHKHSDPQSSGLVAMVRPHHFQSNPETMNDNSFQADLKHNSKGATEIATRAYDEVTQMIETLKDNGINVHVFEDDGTYKTPDSVFPNNWFSTHPDRKLVLYPMYAENRRRERRPDILKALLRDYDLKIAADLSSHEDEGIFLEGTGSMVLDRHNKVAYMALSKRSDQTLLDHFCQKMGYTPVLFSALDDKGAAIYHTNVLMGIGTGYAVICLETIRDEKEKQEVVNSLQQTGHMIIPITTAQMNSFAGNVLELDNGHEKLLAMSKTAFESLTTEQVSNIEKYARILALEVPTIELAGGSVRGMLAELFV